MTQDELKDYYRYLDNIVILQDNIYMARAEGFAEGRAEVFMEGIEKGREEERFATARKMKAKGLDNAIISDVTGLSSEEIDRLL